MLLLHGTGDKAAGALSSGGEGRRLQNGPTA